MAEEKGSHLLISWVHASLMAQRVKNAPAVLETEGMRVWSLGLEDPLEEGMAPHSSTLAWRTPWTEEPGGLQPYGVTKSRTPLKQLTLPLWVHSLCQAPRALLSSPQHLFIWPHQVLVAALRVFIASSGIFPCSTESLVVAHRCNTWALQVWPTASRAHRFSSCGLWA